MAAILLKIEKYALEIGVSVLEFRFSRLTKIRSKFLEKCKIQKNQLCHFTQAYQISRESVEKQKSYRGLKFGS